MWWFKTATARINGFFVECPTVSDVSKWLGLYAIQRLLELSVLINQGLKNFNA
ncbi:MAG: hypothetical protein KDC76_13650 [Bacteroidetes bacterium]|nr:hypothetical protein [Bacteroidota bacterium]